MTVCLEMLAGGIDTTSTAAIFTLYHLAKNPDHQEKLRELLQKEESNVEDYNRETSAFSKYLKACVWESMRLNPLTYANARTTQKDLVLSGYTVPAGTQVRFTSHLMNLENEDYFPKPQEFIPERWQDRHSPFRSVDATPDRAVEVYVQAFGRNGCLRLSNCINAKYLCRFSF